MQLRTDSRRPLSPVTLEITLAPGDLRLVGHMLPHQLRRWAGQVDEILCTVDLEPSPGLPGQPPGAAERLLGLIRTALAPYPQARIAVVDSAPAVAASVARAFFGGRAVPAKTFRGGPFYAYFYGLHEAANGLVLHLDSDMLFGGGSTTWVDEAVALLAADERILVAGPFPGPPRPDGAIMQPARRDEATPWAYAFPTVTSRVFLVDRTRLIERICPLPLRGHAPVRRRVPLRAWLREARQFPAVLRRPLVVSTPSVELPERLLGEAMSAAGLRRVAFLGSGPGMWTLHPRDRSERFYASLETIVDRVERGDVPEEQRGYYDLVDAMLS